MMKKHKFAYILAILFLSTVLFAFTFNETALSVEASVKAEMPRTSASEENFDKMMAVLTHKRCINCHPSGDIPRQGEDSHLHNFGVNRGAENIGLAGYTCNTCHTDQNNEYSGVPGAPHWAVAPKIMAWEGKSRVEIAQQMMDPKRNGGRNHEDIMHHLTEHELVLWAWVPGVDAEGVDREVPPVPKDEFIKAVKEWIEAGAVIPTE